MNAGSENTTDTQSLQTDTEMATPTSNTGRRTRVVYIRDVLTRSINRKTSRSGHEANLTETHTFKFSQGFLITYT